MHRELTPSSANLQAKTYLIFAGWMLFSVLTVFFYLPETRGRSAAELDEMFEAKVPARKFSSKHFLQRGWK